MINGLKITMAMFTKNDHRKCDL